MGGNGKSHGAARRGVPGRWSDHVFVRPAVAGAGPYVLGVLEGEGVGPTVVAAALEVLAAVESSSSHHFRIRLGGPIGLEAERRHHVALTHDVAAFCEDVFAEGGAVLAGAGGGRFVYELRRRFDLFCKLSPLRAADALASAGRLKPEHVRDVDVLLVRENVSGVYQGDWRTVRRADGGRSAEHAFSYSEAEVRRIVHVAARLAAERRGKLTVVLKDGGVPAISDLWREVASAVAAEAGVACDFANVDLAAYRLVQHPHELDVVVAPNLFGDVLADVGAVLLGSRGLSYSGNLAADGAAVYQTNHGAALDLSGTDRANPAGQILALAMLLRQSFALDAAADLVEEALADVWRAGWRSEDLREAGCRVAGTRALAALVAEAVVARARADRSHEAGAPVG
jgi:3-isopropylmalate dehydrogenase